jgi:hypothetical protein
VPSNEHAPWGRPWTCLNARMTQPPPWWLTMPPEELAAVILPLFPSSMQKDERWVMAGIVNWFKTGENVVHRFPRWDDPDRIALAEAMQVLEQARLIIRILDLGDKSTSTVVLTRLGTQVVRANAVRQHLGLGEKPPTA